MQGKLVHNAAPHLCQPSIPIATKRARTLLLGLWAVGIVLLGAILAATTAFRATGATGPGENVWFAGEGRPTIIALQKVRPVHVYEKHDKAMVALPHAGKAERTQCLLHLLDDLVTKYVAAFRKYRAAKGEGYVPSKFSPHGDLVESFANADAGLRWPSPIGGKRHSEYEYASAFYT
jgi:hypothetical protein